MTGKTLNAGTSCHEAMKARTLSRMLLRSLALIRLFWLAGLGRRWRDSSVLSQDRSRKIERATDEYAGCRI